MCACVVCVCVFMFACVCVYVCMRKYVQVGIDESKDQTKVQSLVS